MELIDITKGVSDSTAINLGSGYFVLKGMNDSRFILSGSHAGWVSSSSLETRHPN